MSMLPADAPGPYTTIRTETFDPGPRPPCFQEVSDILTNASIESVSQAETLHEAGNHLLQLCLQGPDPENSSRVANGNV
jgi:hypothetical protein